MNGMTDKYKLRRRCGSPAQDRSGYFSAAACCSWR